VRSYVSRKRQYAEKFASFELFELVLASYHRNLLSAKADGTKLRPHVLINHVRRIEGLSKFKNNLYISYAKKSWLDDELTEEYLPTFVPKGLLKKRRHIVWDSFICHINQATKCL